MQKAIETGVDKLVALVDKQGRISVKQAARELGVSETVIEEWVDFLEEEGIISLEYKLATLYLIPRKLNKKELEQKHKEFHGKKEGFIRRAEVMLADIDRESKVFQDIKSDFQKLKGEISKDLSGMKLKLQELDKFESVKEGLDNEIRAHQKEIMDKMAGITKQIEKEKKKYYDVLLEIRDEEKILKDRTEGALSLREQYDAMKEHIKECDDAVNDMVKAIKTDQSGIGDVEARIERLKKKADNIQSELLHKMSSLDDLIKQKSEKEKVILEKENEILAKAKEKGNMLKGEEQSGRRLVEAFKNFFTKKKHVQNLIDTVNKDRDELERDLITLINTAKALSLGKKQHDFSKHADEVQRKFKEIEKHKEKYEQHLKNLTNLMGKKAEKKKKFSLFRKK